MPSAASPASPASVAATVAALLAGDGLTRIYTAACQVIAVISVAAGLTAWTNGRQLWVTHGGQQEALARRPRPGRRFCALQGLGVLVVRVSCFLGSTAGRGRRRR
jgi:hypothetical protein